MMQDVLHNSKAADAVEKVSGEHIWSTQLALQKVVLVSLCFLGAREMCDCVDMHA